MSAVSEWSKRTLLRMPGLRWLVGRSYVRLAESRFRGSEAYWVERYARGGNSGVGSANELAEFKAKVLNDFVREHALQFCIEYGCGDGNQLELAVYPRYLGFDVSPEAIASCQRRFRDDASKQFKLVDAYAGERAELTLSLDVLYHLVEDEVFDAYMRRLFDSASRHVIIYSSNTDEQEPLQSPHVRHRAFQVWIEENAAGWHLDCHIPNPYPYRDDLATGSSANFYVYSRV
jgi:hypothetical protein